MVSQFLIFQRMSKLQGLLNENQTKHGVLTSLPWHKVIKRRSESTRSSMIEEWQLEQIQSKEINFFTRDSVKLKIDKCSEITN